MLRLVAEVSVFVAIVILIEMLIVPGSMIRRHLRNPTDTSDSQPISDAKIAANEHRTHLVHICVDLRAALEAFNHGLTKRIGVDAAVSSPDPPAILQGSSPVVAAAWTDIRQTLPEISRQLANAETIAHPTVGSNAGASDVDDREILAATDRIEGAQRSHQRLRTELDHIEFEVRSKRGN